MKMKNLFKIGSRSSGACTPNFLLSETTTDNERKREPHLTSLRAVLGIQYEACHFSVVISLPKESLQKNPKKYPKQNKTKINQTLPILF